MSHELGIMTSELQRETTAATLDTVASHGLAVVQLHPWTIAPEVPRAAAIGAGLAATGASLDAAAFESTRRLLDERGIAVAAVDGTYNMVFPDPETRARARSGFERVLDGCAALGTEVVTLSTGTLNPESMWRPDPRNGDAAVWDELVAEMSWAAGRAERAGVTLAFEPEVSNVVDSAARARRLIDEVGSPRVQVLMDGANLFKLGDLARMDELLREAFELLGDDIALAHAKDLDHDGEAGKLGAGRGVLDYGLYLSLLADAGYAGPVILHGLGGRPEGDFDWSFDYVRARLPAARG